jgi:hypothetical protein
MGGFFGGGGGASASNMVGATSSAAGTAGLVPAPAAGEHNAYLGGQGVFLASCVRPRMQNFRSNQYYAPMGAGQFQPTNTAFSVPSVTSRAYLVPIILPAGNVINLGIRVTASSQNGTGYVALYNSDNNGIPLKPVVTSSFSHVASESNVSKTMSISPSVAIKAGLYWGAYHATGVSNPQIQAVQRGNNFASYFFGAGDGADAFSTGGSQSCPYIAISSVGVWPDPISTISADGQASPAIYVNMDV